MKKLLEGKTAIVTGASYGIGFAIAQLYAEEGANVVLTARGQEKLDAAVEEIKKAGGNAIGVTADALSKEDCKKVFAKAIEEFGQVDILVNNAGMGEMWRIESVPDEEIDYIIDLNLKGPLRYCREAVNHMLERNSGSIINISSTNGSRPMCGPAYTAAKGGLNNLTKNIAIRLVGTGVRCNALSPGFTVTPLSTSTVTAQLAPREKSMLPILETRTVRNMPTYPIDQANVALFLASDLSSAVQGQIILVDKGQYL